MEDISKLLCSPPSGSQPHFLLTVAHYIYHAQSFEVPISGLRLLSAVARTFPMSLLACLGGYAEAVRDILVYRLESETENVALKVAIIDLFSACVDSQPGLTQLLIGVSRDVQAVNVSTGAVGLTAEDKAKNEAVKLADDSGCLKSVIALIKVGEYCLSSVS